MDFLSHAAIVGFMGGAATVVILQQLKGILGLHHFTQSTDIISVLRSVFSQIHEVNFYFYFSIYLYIVNLFFFFFLYNSFSLNSKFGYIIRNLYELSLLRKILYSFFFFYKSELKVLLYGMVHSNIKLIIHVLFFMC